MKQSELFDIKELVCPDVYERDGQKAWRYFRPVLIDFLDWFRKSIDRPVYVNDWNWSGQYTQRGYRCNLCELVASKNRLYVSAHMLGAAIDFNVQGMTPNEVRKCLRENIYWFFDEHEIYKHKCRLESANLAPTWVHIDFFDHDHNGIIYEF